MSDHDHDSHFTCGVHCFLLLLFFFVFFFFFFLCSFFFFFFFVCVFFLCVRIQLLLWKECCRSLRSPFFRPRSHLETWSGSIRFGSSWSESSCVHTSRQVDPDQADSHQVAFTLWINLIQINLICIKLIRIKFVFTLLLPTWFGSRCTHPVLLNWTSQNN